MKERKKSFKYLMCTVPVWLLGVACCSDGCSHLAAVCARRHEWEHLPVLSQELSRWSDWGREEAKGEITQPFFSIQKTPTVRVCVCVWVCVCRLPVSGMLESPTEILVIALPIVNVNERVVLSALLHQLLCLSANGLETPKGSRLVADSGDSEEDILTPRTIVEPAWSKKCVSWLTCG